MKVGSMSKGKRILLVTAVLLLAGNGLQAGLFRSRKAAQPAVVSAPAATAMTLTAVEVEPGRIILRTSGTPAYTSYSPSPTVFVVDLTGTSRPADLTIPSTLPPALASISADEAVEMGNQLTRFTVRLTQAGMLQAAAEANSVVITLPAPAIEPVVEAAVEPVTAVEATVEPQSLLPLAGEGARRADEGQPVPAHKAKLLKRIGTSGEGAALQVEIAADGAIDYKAFRLDNPARLVIDVTGVNNRVKSAVDVNGTVVKRVRAGQFKGGPEPVARVVLDLNEKAEYTITPSGEQLLVTFGGAPVLSPAPVIPEPTKPAATIAEIPAVVEEATWKMPPRHVINSADDQAPPYTQPAPRPVPPPTTPRPSAPENVFEEAQPQPLSPGAARTLSGGQRVFSGDPITMQLKDADIKDVIRTFAQLTGLNIAVDPGVTGSVTIDVVDVPWDQVLDLILRQNGLAYTLEGNVMRIGTVDRLAAETAAQRRLAEEERLNVPTSTLSFKLSYARAGEVASLLQTLASPRGRIIMDARTNQLIVTEIPTYLTTMRNLIDTVDIPNRQVVIEARIVETTKTFEQSYGFDWGFDGVLDPALGTGTGLVFPNRIGFVGGPFAFAGPGNIIDLTLHDVLGAFNLDLALHAAESESLARVVSAPKVTTQDNTAAEIQSGIQIPYQTRVNLTTTLTYFDATLRLSVTPQITEAGTIIMDISVQKTTPGRPIEGAAGIPLNTRQARTRVMVRDGGTAVIGGIYQASDGNAQARIPILHQIPVIGALFRSNSMNTTHDELLIFITPKIVRGT
jgi:type IV pilus assembly protein PilQ